MITGGCDKFKTEKLEPQQLKLYTKRRENEDKKTVE